MLDSRLFTEAPPPVSEEEAAALALQHFGVEGVARVQDGECDRNFWLRAGSAGDFVLKVQHPADDGGALVFQNAALQHLAAVDPELSVPRLHWSRQGEGITWLDLGAGAQALRLLSWVPGRPIAELRPFSLPLLASFGGLLARLDRGLSTYPGPTADPHLLWDIQHAAQLRPLLPGIPEPRTRALATAALDRFEAELQPGLAGLPHQVIHNDANPANVLASSEDPERVCGIFDFGDMVHAPRIQELAVAASYVYCRSEDPLGDVLCLVEAYHRGRPLEEAELRLLYDLIATRCAMSCCIGSWRAELFPENAEYLSRSLRIVGEALENLAGLSREEGWEKILRVIEPRKGGADV